MGQGAYILGCAGPVLSAGEAAFFRQADPWGFILFARNVERPEQLRRLTGELRDTVGREAPVLVDQEGGRVQRLTLPHWRSWLPPLDHVAASGERVERSMWLRYRLIAEELRAVGIDVNCAPMADITGTDTHAFLRNRCYGQDPAQVARIGRAVADGLIAGGVLPVLKHIPGHGCARLDSHLTLPRVDATQATLAAQDFAPFRALADLPMAMTAHIVYAALDDAPATTSARVIRLIRDEIGFAGLLMSDDISMQALSGTVAERCARTLAAGCDLVLHCNGDLGEMASVAAASGALGQPGQSRADAALTLRDRTSPIDIAAAEAELAALMNGKVYG